MSHAMSSPRAAVVAASLLTFDRDKVNVISVGARGDTMFPRVELADRCGDLTAWHYDSPDKPTRVALCPRACEAVQAESGTSVKVTFGCQTVVSPE